MATLIKPNGEIFIVLPKNDRFTLDELYNHLDCSTVQVVYLRNGIMWIDEEGKLKPHRTDQINIEATELLIGAGGCLTDYIVGSALITDSNEIE